MDREKCSDWRSWTGGEIDWSAHVLEIFFFSLNVGRKFLGDRGSVRKKTSYCANDLRIGAEGNGVPAAVVQDGKEGCEPVCIYWQFPAFPKMDFLAGKLRFQRIPRMWLEAWSRSFTSSE